jgi:hypothetical protein
MRALMRNRDFFHVALDKIRITPTVPYLIYCLPSSYIQPWDKLRLLKTIETCDVAPGYWGTTEGFVVSRRRAYKACPWATTTSCTVFIIGFSF